MGKGLVIGSPLVMLILGGCHDVHFRKPYWYRPIVWVVPRAPGYNRHHQDDMTFLGSGTTQPIVLEVHFSRQASRKPDHPQYKEFRP